MMLKFFKVPLYLSFVSTFISTLLLLINRVQDSLIFKFPKLHLGEGDTLLL